MKKQPTIDRGDVISVDVGATSAIVKDFDVYACPEDYPHREMSFITLRLKDGGHMEVIYPIEGVYVFSPNSDVPDGIPASQRKRLQGYVQACKASVAFDPADAPHRFYLLAQEGRIELPHHPKPERNQPLPCYFRISDLTSEKKIVQVASKTGSIHS
jgi:hypothetical protein